MISGNIAHDVDATFMFAFWASVLILAGITFAMIYFIIKYHHTRNQQPKDIPHNFWLEFTWTAIPAVLVVILWWYGVKGYTEMENVPADAVKVETTGRMWSWSFKYPNGVETDTLYVPVNRAVELALSSPDVIHSFYVPAFRLKRDVVPGVPTKMWFQADDVGRYDVFCAEYCGQRHSYMYTRVVAMEPQRFQSWYEQAGAGVEKKPAAGAESGGAQLGSRGPMLLQTKGCVACHSTDGSPRVGPSFLGVFGHEVTVITDGRERQVTADEDYLRRSMRQPQADLVKGFESIPMPPPNLTEEEINEIVAYLKQLQ